VNRTYDFTGKEKPPTGVESGMDHLDQDSVTV